MIPQIHITQDGARLPGLLTCTACGKTSLGFWKGARARCDCGMVYECEEPLGIGTFSLKQWGRWGVDGWAPERF